MAGWSIFFIVLAIAVLFLIRGTYETFQLDVSFSVLGEGNKVLRVLLLSDLHAGACRISEKKLRNAITHVKIDAFLFAGDMTCGWRDQEKAGRYLAFIAILAREAGVPMYAVVGNHDYYALNDRLAEFGIMLLRNQSAVLSGVDGSQWLLAGLDDLRIGIPSYTVALENPIEGKSSPAYSMAPELSGKPNPPESYDPARCTHCPVVVLAHNPDTLFSLPRKSNHPLFLLSGHFHGGQIWMPFHLEYRVLRREILPKIGIYKGAYKKDGIAGYISRGLGCVIVPFRLFSYPELAILELRANAADWGTKK